VPVAPPYGSRTTSGTARPNLQWTFAALLTSALKPQATKSANCISTIGFIPAIAAPTPQPMIALSAMGVFRHRSGPNCSPVRA
jgi:hypothetical protein